MRALAVLIVLVVLGGCSAASLMPKGAGQNVYSEDIARESALQETYAGILCRDNGLPHYAAASGGPTCDYPRMTSGHWAIFVNAGLYDIDRRCDSYLEWLFEARRLRDPINNQLGKTGNLTAALLRAFDAANLTIEVVGLAFGYAQDTFANFDPNLLWGVETSTIQAIVLNRQQRAKEEIHALRFSSKPEAMHALRGYLRICMPFTIETDINTTLASGARGFTTKPVVEVNAAATGALEASRQVRESDVIILPDNTAAKQMFLYPENKTEADVKTVQRYACDPNPDGRFGTYSKMIIFIVEDHLGVSGPDADGKLSPAEHKQILDLRSDCERTYYKNSYERAVLSDQDDLDIIVADINKLLPANPLPPGVAFTDPSFPREAFREKLKELRRDARFTVSSIVLEGQLSRSFRALIREHAR